MTVEPFKRIEKVTPDIADNWQKYYVCMYQAERVKTPFCGVVLENRGEYDSWRRLLYDTGQLSGDVFNRPFGTPDNDDYMPSAVIYASGWVLIERKESVEVGVLIDHNEDHKTQLEVTTKILHLPTGQLVGNKFTARLNDCIEMETPYCRMQMMITKVPMEGGA